MKRRITTARLKVSPCLPPANEADSSFANTKLTSQSLLGQGTSPNFKDISISEFGFVVTFSPKRSSSFHHLPHVFGMCSRMKVSGLNTDSPVAKVQNKRFFFSDRIVNIKNSVRNDMCEYGNPSHTTECSVSLCVNTPRPVPAPVGGRVFRHKPPESFSLRKPLGSTDHKEWVTASSPSLVVSVAPSSGTHDTLTVGDSTEKINHTGIILAVAA